MAANPNPNLGPDDARKKKRRICSSAVKADILPVIQSIPAFQCTEGFQCATLIKLMWMSTSPIGGASSSAWQEGVHEIEPAALAV